MSSKLATIVIPVYNGSNYMRAAIDSALAQTWANTEVIVVNDGSIDGGETDRIARSYGSKIVYISKLNGGVASALNAGIAVMKGDVFCWLSHDDRHLPNKTERQMAEWGERAYSDVVLFSDYRLIDANGDKITDVALDHALLTSKPLYPLLRGSIHGCSIFIPKKIINDIGVFDVTLPTTQDYDLWHRMIQRYRFHHMAEVLIESRWHDEQTSKKIDHIVEATEFWKRAISVVAHKDRVLAEGSSVRFLNEMSIFLNKNGLSKAASSISAAALEELSRTKVSIVIPVFNRMELAISAVESAARQTHTLTEIIVVDDGSTEPFDALRQKVELVGGRFMRQENQGPAAARNTGWRSATGEYVAFLDSDDLFAPEKISIQLRAMAEAGAAFSHTSYFRHWFNRVDFTYIASGAANAYPSIIGGCGIATPTVMVRRDLIDDGFEFPTEFKVGEDIVLWLRIAARFGVLGCDRGLTIVRVDDNSAAHNLSKQKAGIDNVLSAIRDDPKLMSHKGEYTRLVQLRTSLGVM